jgi:hypothetical protein
MPDGSTCSAPSWLVFVLVVEVTVDSASNPQLESLLWHCYSRHLMHLIEAYWVIIRTRIRAYAFSNHSLHLWGHTWLKWATGDEVWGGSEFHSPRSDAEFMHLCFVSALAAVIGTTGLCGAAC